MAIAIRQTETFAVWFENLRDRRARARIQIRIDRLALGNSGDARPVGQGASELRINYGPGYRVFLSCGEKRRSCCSLAVTSGRRPATSPPRESLLDSCRRRHA